jgi:hypothetical protein
MQANHMGIKSFRGVQIGDRKTAFKNTQGLHFGFKESVGWFYTSPVRGPPPQ